MKTPKFNQVFIIGYSFICQKDRHGAFEAKIRFEGNGQAKGLLGLKSFFFMGKWPSKGGVWFKMRFHGKMDMQRDLG